MGYYLGLDMGTNSVGWAVTDKNYKLLRAKGKDLWGIREFEEASTSVERRTKRIARRRHQREKARMGLLRSYFDEAVLREDSCFFVRLDNSRYFPEDKDSLLADKNVLFDDADYKDADYYREYPTVFHLRQALIYDRVEYDSRYARKVYLAVSNMYKHRGHFLDNGLSDGGDELPKISVAYGNLVETLDKITEEESAWTAPAPDCEKIKDILSDRGLSRSAKKDRLTEVLGVEKKNKQGVEITKALCGLKFDAKKLFGLEELEEKLDIEFSSGTYEDNAETYHQLMGDEYFDVVLALKAIYDIGRLSATLGDYNYLSDARVASYDDHKADLKLLKSVMRRYNTKEEYDAMFRSETDGSYSAYVKSFNSGKKNRRAASGRKKADIYDTIKKMSKSWNAEDPDVLTILGSIGTESFLLKQLNPENGVIPNQVHTKELRVILKNAEQYLPFLNEKDESGLTVSERITALFTFQIPYYIGPVTEKSEKDKGTGWVIRKENGRVLPWNLEDKIDIPATSERFIMRMVRKCSYISGESVLPKESLIYQKYCVLNEINNLRIRGERIDVQLKQDIYTTLYEKGKKVTRKALVKYLISRDKSITEEDISGIDRELNNYLGSHGKFWPIFGEELKKDSCIAMVEDIIRTATIFGDSKAFLKKRLEEKYSAIISEKDMKRILGLKFRDWGRLSGEFLELQGCDENGEVMSLISALWNTSCNCMELINSDRFAFKAALAEKQNREMKALSEFTAEDLEDYYFSAPVRRMIWQTLKIIKELAEVLGEYPEKVFVEMTRSEGEKGDKGRKDSRKKMFLDLYKSVKNETCNWNQLIEDSDRNGKLKSKKMFLYLTQKGKCMYCGKHIDLDKLYTPDYDIDHIYPRSQVKDDNLTNNLVLVHKYHNAVKSDTYPIDASIRCNDDIRNLWKALRTTGFVNEEKYKRLTGSMPFTDEQRAEFIARQIVETGQGTKGVAELLKQFLPRECTIVYAKARAVSEFRNDHKDCMTKSRLVNDFHHANDAYLNIVVGNVYYTKFTHNPLNFIKRELGSKDKNGNTISYNLARMYARDITRGEETAWVADKKNKDGAIIEEGTIATVKAVMKKNTPLMTRMNFEATGGFANETLYGASKAKPDAYIPFKSMDDKLKDVTKYGGFTSVSIAYFFLVEHEVKGKRVRTMECAPIMLAGSFRKSDEALLNYCRDTLGLINPEIRLRKINIQSLVERNGYRLYISGKTNNRFVVKNAVNLILSSRWVRYLKEMEKDDYDREVIIPEDNLRLYDILTEKHCSLPFAGRPNPVGDKLRSGREVFETLSVEQQRTVILEIMKLHVIGNTSADLALIKQASNTGVMLIPKKISAEDSMVLVNQSVTGLYEERTDLLRV